MGVAMAGMLVPGLAVTSRAVIWVAGLRIAFAVAAVWYAWLTLHGRQVHHAQHALACAAMI